jgi:hypothetical protein
MPHKYVLFDTVLTSDEIGVGNAQQVLLIESFGFATKLEKGYLIEFSPVKDLCAQLSAYAVKLHFQENQIQCNSETDGSFLGIRTKDNILIGFIFARTGLSQSHQLSIYEHERYHALYALGTHGELNRFHRLIKEGSMGQIDLTEFGNEKAARYITILSHLANGANLNQIESDGWGLEVIDNLRSLGVYKFSK